MAKQVKMLDRFAEAVAGEFQSELGGPFDVMLFDPLGVEITVTSVKSDGNTITMNVTKDSLSGKKRDYIATLVVTEWHRAPST